MRSVLPTFKYPPTMFTFSNNSEYKCISIYLTLSQPLDLSDLHTYPEEPESPLSHLLLLFLRFNLVNHMNYIYFLFAEGNFLVHLSPVS